MSDDFFGAGPPPAGGGGGGAGKLPKNFAEHGFSEQVTRKTKDGKLQTFPNRIFTWKLDKGETNRPILLLDAYAKRFTACIHTFTGRDGKFDNRLASPWDPRVNDPKVDPMIEALGDRPTWYWVLTGIDLGKSVSKKTGKTYTNTRVAVLVTDRQKDQFLTMEKLTGGLRGHIFNVSRDTADTSYRIGTKWDPTGEKLTDEQLIRRFESVAADYGLPVEKFTAPFDYQVAFKPKSYEELSKIAAEYKGATEARADVKVAGASGDEEINF